MRNKILFLLFPMILFSCDSIDTSCSYKKMGGLYKTNEASTIHGSVATYYDFEQNIVCYEFRDEKIGISFNGNYTTHIECFPLKKDERNENEK